MRRYSSGQRGQTVNLLTYVYEGSNPSRRTKYQNQRYALVLLYLVALGGIRTERRGPSGPPRVGVERVRFYERSERKSTRVTESRTY